MQNEDEIAGVVACEIAHVLARHTFPVQFALWSDVFFDTAELATSIALMQLTHGAVSINGRGWMKWAYVEISDRKAHEAGRQASCVKSKASRLRSAGTCHRDLKRKLINLRYLETQLAKN